MKKCNKMLKKWVTVIVAAITLIFYVVHLEKKRKRHTKAKTKIPLSGNTLKL